MYWTQPLLMSLKSVNFKSSGLKAIIKKASTCILPTKVKEGCFWGCVFLFLLQIEPWTLEQTQSQKSHVDRFAMQNSQGDPTAKSRFPFDHLNEPVTLRQVCGLDKSIQTDQRRLINDNKKSSKTLASRLQEIFVQQNINILSCEAMHFVRQHFCCCPHSGISKWRTVRATSTNFQPPLATDKSIFYPHF